MKKHNAMNKPWNGPDMRQVALMRYRKDMNTVTLPVMREEVGDVLRKVRRGQGRTLRQVSSEAKVSLGYLSEVERGQKEASSELLSAICQALGLPISILLREVADRFAVAEGLRVPDTVPDELMREQELLEAL